MKYGIQASRAQFSLIMIAFVFACSVDGYATGYLAQKDLGTQYDSRLRIVKDKIAHTTPEGLQILKKVQAMKIEVNKKRSLKTLGGIVEDYEQGKGAFKIHPVGWEALKRINGNWKIAFYYQKEEAEYVVGAEWEYNPTTNKLYIFEFENSPSFWTKTGKYGK